MIIARTNTDQPDGKHRLHIEEAAKAIRHQYFVPDMKAAQEFASRFARHALPLANRPDIPLLRVGLMAPPRTGKSHLSNWFRYASEPSRPSEMHEPDCGDCYVELSRTAGWIRAYDSAHVRAFETHGENALLVNERDIRMRRPYGVDISQHPQAEFNKQFHHIIEYHPASAEGREITLYSASELAGVAYMHSLMQDLQSFTPEIGISIPEAAMG